MGVKRQNHHLVNAVGLDVGYSRFCEGMPVAHRHVAGGINPPLTQHTLKLTSLLLSDASQR